MGVSGMDTHLKEGDLTGYFELLLHLFCHLMSLFSYHIIYNWQSDSRPVKQKWSPAICRVECLEAASLRSFCLRDQKSFPGPMGSIRDCPLSDSQVARLVRPSEFNRPMSHVL